MSRCRASSAGFIAAVVLAGCGGSHAGQGTTGSRQVSTATSASSVPKVTHTAPMTVSTVSPPAAPAAPPHLSRIQTVAFEKGCQYFSGDVGALTGELKMSNLTAAELREAARYVAGDLAAFRPALGASLRTELASTTRVVTQAMSAQQASSQELSAVGAHFQSRAFASLNRGIAAACRSLRR